MRPGPYFKATRRPDGTEVFDTPMAYYTATRMYAGSGTAETDFLEGPGYETRTRSMSWMYWWELNQEGYLREARSKHPPAIPRIAPTPNAVTVLMKGAESPNPAIRREAILSLGRVRHAPALELLKRSTKDSDDTCRLPAWSAIGLLDTPEAMGFLETPPPAGQLDRIGWTVAVAMLSEPNVKIWETLRKFLVDPACPEAQRITVQAIRIHRPFWGREALIDALQTEFADAVLQAVIAAIGDYQDPRDIPNLVAIAKNGAAGGCDWPLIQNLQKAIIIAKDKITIRGASPPVQPLINRLQSFRRPAFLALGSYGNKLTHAGADALRTPIIRDVSNITIKADEHKREVLMAGGGLSNPHTQEMGIQDCAILGLGYLGDPDDVEMMRLLDGMPNPKPGKLEQSILTHPLEFRRGWATLAMGLHMRRAGGDAGQAYETSNVTLRPQLPVEDALNNVYQQETALNSFRAATAVAFALSGDAQYTRLIKQPLPRLQPGQEPVYGYALQALGMLGDKEALAWFREGFEPPQQKLDAAKLASSAARPAPMSRREFLARRAAIQGMAALGEPEAIPSLIAQWGKQPLLDVEVARAVLWCRRDPISPAEQDLATTFGESLAQLANDKSPALAGSALASLGELFDRGGRARLARLIEDTDWEQLAFPLPPVRLPLYYAPQLEVVSMANPVYPGMLRPVTLRAQNGDRLLFEHNGAPYMGIK